MSAKDEIILMGSGVVSVDVILNSINNPGLLLAWGLFLSLYGAAGKLRQERILDWVESIRDNPEIFTRELFDNEEFQDGFAYLTQRFIRERNSNKRKIIKNIFFGFAQAEKGGEFEFEKITSVLDSLSLEDIEILKIWVDGSIKKWDVSQGVFPEDYESVSLNSIQIGENILSEMNGMSAFTSREYSHEKLSYLVSIGVLKNPKGNSIYPNDDSFALSVFGKNFVQFIIDFS